MIERTLGRPGRVPQPTAPGNPGNRCSAPRPGDSIHLAQASSGTPAVAAASGSPLPNWGFDRVRPSPSPPAESLIERDINGVGTRSLADHAERTKVLEGGESDAFEVVEPWDESAHPPSVTSRSGCPPPSRLEPLGVIKATTAGVGLASAPQGKHCGMTSAVRDNHNATRAAELGCCNATRGGVGGAGRARGWGAGGSRWEHVGACGTCGWNPPVSAR